MKKFSGAVLTDSNLECWWLKLKKKVAKHSTVEIYSVSGE